MTMAIEVKASEEEWQLVAQCRAGDLDAFGQVYRQHGDAVFRHAFYLMGHHEDADDVKQETFLRAYRALHAFRQDSALRTWLLRICSNLCYDRLKRRRRQPEITFAPQQTQHYHAPASDDSDPFFALARADTLHLLLRVLQGMPPPQRNLIALHILEDMDYRQIGEILGCAPTTAKMRVLRATRQYKERVTALLNTP